MRAIRFGMLAGLVLVVLGAQARTQQAPSYAKDVRPFLAKYCLECHNGKALKGGLDLETYKSLRAGADSGEVVVPGKADSSRIVLLVEGKDDPKMPPKKAKFQPTPKEYAVLRAWVDAGAKDDSGSVKTSLPAIKPRLPVAPAVAAAAYRPDGKLLAAAAYKEVILIDPHDGTILGKLADAGAGITALAFSRDGKRLAVASQKGTIRLVDVATGQEQRRLPGHDGAAVAALAFSPDGKMLASGSLDATAKLWEVETGREKATLQGHKGLVLSLAWSPDARELATGERHGTVRTWNADSGQVRLTLPGHLGAWASA